MFALSVVVIILALYLAAAWLEAYALAAHGAVEPRWSSHLDSNLYKTERFWNPGLFLAVTVGTLVIVCLGSLYKIYELSAGGETVALMLGGRVIDPQTTGLAGRRLLNVVEEMALASGVPVPPVYVLENEPGINAFAAGHQPSDAVVAVSRAAWTTSRATNSRGSWT